MARPYDDTIPEVISKLEARWEEVVGMGGTTRNKAAIELHSQLESFENRLHFTPPSPEKDDAATRLKDVTEDVLVRVFNIDVSKVPAWAEVPDD